ncbi:MAG: hypothetical protein Q7U73_10250 [Rubrivivax sp.]|nr:hypothetical protein [Rubrivivax sp.]
MNTRLLTSAVLALSLLASGAASAADATGGLPQVAAPQGQQTVRSMFTFADRNKDGQLTRAEAKGHLPATYASFDSIDAAKRGWISVEQFAEFTNQRVGKQAEDVLKVGQWH